MTFAQAIRLILTRFDDYRGRSSRAEYWWGWGASILLGILVTIASTLLAPGLSKDQLNTVFLVFFYLPVFVFGLPLEIRRLHDTGRSGWWILLSLIPFGGLVILYFLLQPSGLGENQYGSNPYEEE